MEIFCEIFFLFLSLIDVIRVVRLIQLLFNFIVDNEKFCIDLGCGVRSAFSFINFVIKKKFSGNSREMECLNPKNYNGCTPNSKSWLPMTCNI